jgi:hypothetical protein
MEKPELGQSPEFTEDQANWIESQKYISCRGTIFVRRDEVIEFANEALLETPLWVIVRQRIRRFLNKKV